MSRDIVVERIFASFDDFWETSMLTPTMGSIFATLTAPAAAGVKERVRAALRIEGGKVVHSARASAVKGVVPS